MGASLIIRCFWRPNSVDQHELDAPVAAMIVLINTNRGVLDDARSKLPR
jgi:hypothetical protein